MRRKKKALTLVAGTVPQMRKNAGRDWTKAKAETFLGVLTDTCNVSEACRESGVPMTVAYRQKKLDSAFRAAWLEAIAVAYSKLEMMLLDRAFNGTEKYVLRKDGGQERMLEYSNALGLQLLKMHRDTAIEADSDIASEDADEIRARIVNKLQRLKKRNDEQEADRAQLRGAEARDADADERDSGAATPGV